MFVFILLQIKAVVINDQLEVTAETHVHFDSMLPEYRTSGGVHVASGGRVTAPSIMWVHALDMLMDRKLDPTGKSSNYGRRGRHVKTHGKIGFQDLAKRIAARWKSLPPEELAEYKRLAEMDTKRYKEDMEKFEKDQEEVDAAETLKGMSLSTS